MSETEIRDDPEAVRDPEARPPDAPAEPLDCTVRVHHKFRPYACCSNGDGTPALEQVFCDPDGWLVASNTKVLSVIPAHVGNACAGRLIPRHLLRLARKYPCDWDAKQGHIALTYGVDETEPEGPAWEVSTSIGRIVSRADEQLKFPDFLRVLASSALTGTMPAVTLPDASGSTPPPPCTTGFNLRYMRQALRALGLTNPSVARWARLPGAVPGQKDELQPLLVVGGPDLRQSGFALVMPCGYSNPREQDGYADLEAVREVVRSMIATRQAGGAS